MLNSSISAAGSSLLLSFIVHEYMTVYSANALMPPVRYRCSKDVKSKPSVSPYPWHYADAVIPVRLVVDTS